MKEEQDCMGMYLLGVDIGTSSSKGIICDLEGKMISTSSITHMTSIPQKCWAEHNANEVWWGDFKKICAELFYRADIKAKEIAAVGCSGLGPTMVPIDKSGNPLRPAILYGSVEWLLPVC
jgi:xylulokinase